MKKIFALSLISLFFVQMFYFAFEPTLTNAANPDNVVVTLNVTSGVTLSDGANATMSPNMGVTSDRSVGSSSWSVATNSTAGYTLVVKASTDPALKNGSIDNFANYTEASVGTPDAWGNVATGAKEFGFSAHGTDVPVGTWGAAANCGNTSTGVTSGTQLYRGFTSNLSDVQIAGRGTFTPNGGITTNICFAAQQNGVYAASGSYTATITATAAAL